MLAPLLVAAALAAQPTSPAAKPKPKPKPTAKGDAPEISRSIGEEGGVVVFWPRVLPKAQREPHKATAWALQGRLKALVDKTLPGKKVDVRPAPERVCPRAGCKAMTVGVLLYAREGGCVAVALVAGPGKGAQQLVPWGGEVKLKKAVVPFREPPESAITVKDFARCDEMLDTIEMAEREAAIETTLRAVAGLAAKAAKP
jgi:hypothetical protein